jgi:hypothetical protein
MNTEKIDLLNEEDEEVKPSPARLVESLRDTGYTFPTAVADIIDNSIAANATQVRIQLTREFDGSAILLIADNGQGMDETGVKSAMKYGASARPSAKSLGKFGMGLKTASTSQCRKLTLISKKNGNYSARQWDLDIIKEKDKWILLEPGIDSYQEHIDFLDNLTNGANGTLIIWENIDRLMRAEAEGSGAKQIEKITEDLRNHLSGVYYNFLKEGNEYSDVKISVNEIPLEPYDPLCRWLNEKDQKRLDIHKNPLKVIQKVNSEDKIVGTFDLNVYILPIKNDLSDEELAKSRYGLDEQGFHVFREGRMIASGGWPHRMFVKEPHLNLIRVELDFNHELDDFFQIDIKKSRIDIPHAWRKEIKKMLIPPRREAIKRYRKGGNNTSRTQEGLDLQHDKSSGAINRHHESVTSGSKVDSIDKNKGEAEIVNKFGKTKVRLLINDSRDKVVQTSDSLQDAVLWAPALVDENKHAVVINSSHEFYKRFYYPNIGNPAMVLAMDSLLWSLAEAELSVMSDKVRQNIEEMRISVSRTLRILAEELPEADESENKEGGEEE